MLSSAKKSLAGRRPLGQPRGAFLQKMVESLDTETRVLTAIFSVFCLQLPVDTRVYSFTCCIAA
jgi:hypothetical protein